MQFKYYLYALFSALFFAIQGAGIKLILEKYHNINYFLMVFWGILGISLFLTPFFLMFRNSRLRMQKTLTDNFYLMLVISLMNVAMIFGYFYSLEHSSLGSFSLLFKTSVLFSMFLGIVFLHDRFSNWEIFGSFLAIIGIIIVSSIPGEFHQQAILSSLGCALLSAGQGFIIKKYARNIYGKEFALVRTIFFTIFLAIALLLFGKIYFIGWYLFLTISSLLICGVFIGRGFYFSALEKLEVSKLNILMMIEIIFSLLAGYFFFAEQINSKKMIGMVLVIGGLVVLIAKRQQCRH